MPQNSGAAIHVRMVGPVGHARFGGNPQTVLGALRSNWACGGGVRCCHGGDLTWRA